MWEERKREIEKENGKKKSLPEHQTSQITAAHWYKNTITNLWKQVKVCDLGCGIWQHNLGLDFSSIFQYNPSDLVTFISNLGYRLWTERKKKVMKSWIQNKTVNLSDDKSMLKSMCTHMIKHYQQWPHDKHWEQCNSNTSSLLNFNNFWSTSPCKHKKGNSSIVSSVQFINNSLCDIKTLNNHRVRLDTHTGTDSDSLLVECLARDQKVANLNPGRSGRRIFFSRVNFVCWLLFCVRSTPVSPK